jgi:uncharacterized lipoprotein YmbA
VRRDPWPKWGAGLALGFFLGACAAREALPQFYLLTPSRPDDPRSRGGGPSVYVQRVQVPGYLAKNSLVMLRAGNQVDYAQSAKWAEPLDQGVARMVAEGLNRAARVRATAFTPAGPPGASAYSVEIRLQRFEGTDAGEVVLAAHYDVFSASGTEPIASRGFETRRTGWQPRDYPSLARLLSDELTEMSRSIARSL